MTHHFTPKNWIVSHLVYWAFKLSLVNFPTLAGPRTQKIQDPHFPMSRVQVLVPEIERRKSHIDQINPAHPFLPIVTDCLSYNEEDRPCARELCHRLGRLKEDSQYSESVQQTQEKDTYTSSTMYHS